MGPEVRELSGAEPGLQPGGRDAQPPSGRSTAGAGGPCLGVRRALGAWSAGVPAEKPSGDLEERRTPPGLQASLRQV